MCWPTQVMYREGNSMSGRGVPMFGHEACHCPTPRSCFVETVGMMPLLAEPHCVALRAWRGSLQCTLGSSKLGILMSIMEHTLKKGFCEAALTKLNPREKQPDILYTRLLVLKLLMQSTQ